MILKKKEIIAASLVVLIGVAGYLNWSYQDTIRVQDGESYIETGKKLGEAQYVSSPQEMEDNTAADDTDDNTAVDDDDKNDDAENETTETEEARQTAADGGENYFEQARMNRESARSKSLEILNQTAENESFDGEIRKKAGDKILAVADNVQKENQIESIAQSKGYSEICAFADDNSVSITVRKEGFGNEDVVKLTAIATEELGISAQNVKIVEVK
jgi:stage III sporulation protein AH